MELFGCGFNGFGQLLPQTPKRRLLSPVKIVLGSELQTPLTVKETPEKASSYKFVNAISLWSSIYVLIDTRLLWQGFHSGKKLHIPSVKKQDEFHNRVVDMDGSGEKLYYITADGECVVMDTGTGQELKVKGHDDAVSHFVKVSAGDMKTVVVTDEELAGLISSENLTYVFRPFDCAVKFSQVSCGKEHVLLLSQNHQVYSFGLGSRGQLGHGTTDGESQPRLLEALECVAMKMVSAGGWHSAAVSTIGDLYIWGWNESGQLGFPLQRNSQSTCESTSQDATEESPDYQLSQDEMHGEAKRSLREEAYAHQGGAKKRKTSSLESAGLTYGRDTGEFVKVTHGDQREGCLTPSRRPDSKVQLQDQQQLPKTSLVQEDCIIAKSKETEDNESRKESGDSRGDAVLFQALPSILDLPNGTDVSKVSCGSRHTAAISEDGRLYTWGWSAYGQLGHGDTRTRDTPTMVEWSTQDQVKVMDVYCGAWNTLFTVIH